MVSVGIVARNRPWWAARPAHPCAGAHGRSRCLSWHRPSAAVRPVAATCGGYNDSRPALSAGHDFVGGCGEGTVHGGLPGPHLHVRALTATCGGYKDPRPFFFVSLGFAGGLWRGTVHGGLPGQAIHGLALVAACDAFHRIARAPLLALLQLPAVATKTKGRPLSGPAFAFKKTLAMTCCGSHARP
jgi:hypothetical protein